MSDPKKQYRCLVTIRLRGSARVNPELQKTFDSLRLKSKYSAVVVYNTPSIKGMLQKAKDNITWGEISSETLSKLLRIKGIITGISPIDDEYVKKVFPKYGSIEKLAAAITEGNIGLHDLTRLGIKLVFRFSHLFNHCRHDFMSCNFPSV